MGDAAPPSVIGSDLRITGELFSAGEIQVLGTLDGTVQAARVTVAVGGQVTGTISAEQIVIGGAVEGEIYARSVDVKDGARVDAEIRHEQISVAAGAVLLGRIKRETFREVLPAKTWAEPETVK